MNQEQADNMDLRVDRMLKDLSYETVEIIFRKSHRELQDRWMRGETK